MSVTPNQAVADSPASFRQVPIEPGPGGKSTVPDRLVSLDAFRGFIMTVLAANGFGLATFAEHPQLGWLGGQFEHVAWQGGGFWDLIQPAFMFMVGLAMPFAFRVRERQIGPAAVWKHVAYRALMLVVLSNVLIAVSAGEFKFQLINVLAQIAFAYLIAYAVMQLPLRAQFAAGAAILVAHTALFQLFPGADGPWSQADNVGTRIDHFFGLEYSGFYVTINFVSSSVTTLLGVWCGYLMIAPNSHKRRLQVLAAAVAGCWLSGLLLSLVIPDVKRIWTASFTLLSGGWVILLLLAFYWMVEVKGWRRATFPLVVVGMNSLFIYSTKMVLGGWLRDKIGIFAGDFQFLGDWAPVASYTAAFAALWYLCYWLYQRKIFIKI